MKARAEFQMNGDLRRRPWQMPLYRDTENGGNVHKAKLKKGMNPFLILSGLPHREVVLRAGVSDGTVSAIRQQLKAERPVYRATESASCVSFACAEGDDKQSSTAQPIEIIGGPGRIRTCDQAVMSGRL